MTQWSGGWLTIGIYKENKKLGKQVSNCQELPKHRLLKGKGMTAKNTLISTENEDFADKLKWKKERKIYSGKTAKDSPRKPLKKFISIGVLRSFFLILMQEENRSARGKTCGSKFGLETNCTYSTGTGYRTRDSCKFGIDKVVDNVFLMHEIQHAKS